MEPVFFVQVYGERQELLECIQRLQLVYPGARVILRLDGDRADPGPLAALKGDSNLEWVVEERLHTVEHGGRSCQRMLELFLAGPGDMLIKIDPDTVVRRRFRGLPAGEQLFWGGTPQVLAGLVSLQGGCIVMSRAFCCTVADSKLLLSDSLKPPGLEWAGASPLCLWRARVGGLTSHDWCLAVAARSLKIPAQEYGEVLSRWRSFRLSDASRFRKAAVVHPVRHRSTLRLGPFSWSNLKAHWREQLELAELVPWPLPPDQSNSKWVLDTCSLGEADLPVTLLRWLCCHFPAGACLSGSFPPASQQQLDKFFLCGASLRDSQLVLLEGVEQAVETALWVVCQPKASLFFALWRRRPRFHLHYRGASFVFVFLPGKPRPLEGIRLFLALTVWLRARFAGRGK